MNTAALKNPSVSKALVLTSKAPWFAYHVTGICAVPGDDEQTTCIAITNGPQEQFERDGNFGDLIAYVPCDDGLERAQEDAKRFAAVPDLIEHLSDCINALDNTWDLNDGDEDPCPEARKFLSALTGETL